MKILLIMRHLLTLKTTLCVCLSLHYRINFHIIYQFYFEVNAVNVLDMIKSLQDEIKVSILISSMSIFSNHNSIAHIIILFPIRFFDLFSFLVKDIKKFINDNECYFIISCDKNTNDFLRCL